MNDELEIVRVAVDMAKIKAVFEAIGEDEEISREAWNASSAIEFLARRFPELRQLQEIFDEIALRSGGVEGDGRSDDCE